MSTKAIVVALDMGLSSSAQHIIELSVQNYLKFQMDFCGHPQSNVDPSYPDSHLRDTLSESESCSHMCDWHARVRRSEK